MAAASRGRGRRSGQGVPTGRTAARRYPRAARVNRVLQEVLAEALERMASTDERLGMLTLTEVDCDPDLAAATLLFASLDEAQLAALTDARVRLQAEIARQVRLKRTPLLRFGADPAVASGNRIEEILRDLGRTGQDRAEAGPAGADPTDSDPADSDPADSGPSGLDADHAAGRDGPR